MWHAVSWRTENVDCKDSRRQEEMCFGSEGSTDRQGQHSLVEGRNAERD